MDKLLTFFTADKNRGDLTQAELQSLMVTFIFAIALSIVHAVLTVFFKLQQIDLFAGLNVLSVIIYILSTYLIANGKKLTAIKLISFELCAISILATYYLSWDANMQWYVIVGIIPVFLFYNLSRSKRIAYTSVFALTFLVNIYLALKNEAPIVINKHIFIVFQGILIFSGIILLLATNIWLQQVSSRYYESVISILEKESNVDPVTGAYNRRYAYNFFSEKLHSPGCANYCISLIDIDNFKSINDTYGHAIGDEILKFLVNHMKSYFRGSDIIIRWGGEEFLIIFCGAAIDKIKPILTYFIESLKGNTVYTHGYVIKFTVTAGLVQSRKGKTIEDLIEESDKLLYIGKRTGKAKLVSEDEDIESF